jgi:ribosomal protein S27E
MNLRCPDCGRVNNIPANAGNIQFRCYNCGALLPQNNPPSADTSEAVGLIGGAVLGGAIGGPVGAIVGAIIGAVLGRETKGAA